MEDKFNIINGLKANLKSIFSLKESVDTELSKCFKVLIFDDSVFEILSPLLKVYSLREENICLHLNIKAQKEEMPGIMAIYLIEPSLENFNLIKNDMNKKIFDSYYFVFTKTILLDDMKSFFNMLHSTGQHDKIFKIECYPMGLLAYHSRIFSLNINKPYYLLNAQNISEEQVEGYFNKVANGIFNLLFTLNCIPVVKYRTGWFAENIVKEIQSLYDYSLDKFPDIKSRINSKNEVLLVILDRESDLPIMFHHPASLGGMMQDLFGVNPTKISQTETKNNKDNKNYLPPLEVDPSIDTIWNNYCSSSYIETVEQIIKDEIKKISEETKFLDDNPMNSISGKTENDLSKLSEKMSATLDNLKDIQMKKNMLNNYAKYHSQLYSEVNKRHLGEYYMLEESILIKRSKQNEETKKQFFEILNEEKFKIDIESNNSKLDLLRLTLIYFLINPDIKQDEYNLIESKLTNLKIDISSLSYLKSKKEFLKGMSLGNNQNNEYSNGMFQKGFSYLVNRIGGIMSETQPSLVSDIVSNLSSGKEVVNYVEYNFLTKDKVVNKGTSFSKVIVYICGGGSLVEYESVDAFLSQKGKQVSSVIMIFIIIVIRYLR